MKIHFVAIGGSIMHNLAIALHKRGYQVTGSDDEIFEPAKQRLAHYGLLPSETGWHPENLDTGVECVILGMHAKKDNPELVKAQQKGIPVYSFPEFMGKELQSKTRVVITGSHGKTTITSMVMHVLKKMDWSFDYMVGAPVEGFEDSVSINKDSEVAILEGDEYLSSSIDNRPKFLHYEPQMVLVSGIAWDHMNVFPTYESYVQAFRDLMVSMPVQGKVIYYEDDPEVVKLVSEFKDKLQLFPYNEPNWELVANSFSINYQGNKFPLKIPGRHNLWNLQGACNICTQLGIHPAHFWNAAQDFKGAGKRLELMVEKDATLVYRDFAHAPSKVKATIDGLKTQYPDKKLLVCLELHTYSSLNKEFLPQYKGTTNEADECLVFINPHALELKQMPDINSEEIHEAFDDPRLQMFKDENVLMDTFRNYQPDNTIVVFMSSGNFNGYPLMEMVEKWIVQ